MKFDTKHIVIFGGWSGSFILLLILLLTEVGSYIIGGDWGAFLYVTFHFILIPFLSIFVLGITGIKIYKMHKLLSRVITFIAISIPLSILYVTITGSTVLLKFLNINFK